ncbi:uncharacterized protein LOC142171827 [Nicotiana tabacum]|uniref:Uncharacterized protein LOC142171827 n=1 Tax=Nicotiana tabacum TaxID=4097 RepID=A0AC58T321_TOBAC
MGFCEIIIDMIWRTMSNNWYSVIVNSTGHGFFKYTRGLKKGDPLSTPLFIIGVELLTRMLNNLTHDQFFNCFNMEKRGPQKINKNRSHFMVPACVFHYNVSRIQQITGFTRKESSITYLGCPLYIGRKRIMYFNGLISKMMGRIRGWHGKLLSYGGRVTLIKHVLQSLPIHFLSVVSPPKTVMKQIEKMAA